MGQTISARPDCDRIAFARATHFSVGGLRPGGRCPFGYNQEDQVPLWIRDRELTAP